jgi:pyruvate formate lyase activating enzyme
VIKNLQYLIDKNAKVTARVPIIPGFNTESDVEKSILTLQQMGIKDIERFTYTIKEHLLWKKGKEYVRH